MYIPTLIIGFLALLSPTIAQVVVAPDNTVAPGPNPSNAQNKLVRRHNDIHQVANDVKVKREAEHEAQDMGTYCSPGQVTCP
ncbi:hypothetical protein NX059_000357 [Plenodomus lindquistii]|nr:hypothetical protein NX059_000357 [Plenodomus lindquistii]